MDLPAFFTNHAYALLCVARDPDMRLHDVARVLGITERAAQRILADLVEAGYLSRTLVGRRHHYETRLDLPMRALAVRSLPVSALLDLLATEGAGTGQLHRGRPRRRRGGIPQIA